MKLLIVLFKYFVYLLTWFSPVVFIWGLTNKNLLAILFPFFFLFIFLYVLVSKQEKEDTNLGRFYEFYIRFFVAVIITTFIIGPVNTFVLKSSTINWFYNVFYSGSTIDIPFWFRFLISHLQTGFAFMVGSIFIVSLKKGK